MTLQNKIRISLLAIAILLAGWQFKRQLRMGRELANIQAQLQARQQELETRRKALAEAEQKYNAIAEAERLAGNQTLLSLMRERAAVTAMNSDAALETRKIEGALANLLNNPAQQEIDRQAMRDTVRADMHLFFTLTRLSPERIEEAIDLHIEMEQRKAARLSALLRRKMELADALRERDQDLDETERRRSAIFGSEGEKFFQSIADGMRNDEAKRLLGAIRENLGDNPLNSDQGDRLRDLIKNELVAIKLDDTDLFRSTDDWVQYVGGHQQNVLNAAAHFLTHTQLNTIKGLAEIDLGMKKDEMLRRRKSLGIK